MKQRPGTRDRERELEMKSNVVKGKPRESNGGDKANLEGQSDGGVEQKRRVFSFTPIRVVRKLSHFNKIKWDSMSWLIFAGVGIKLPSTFFFFHSAADMTQYRCGLKDCQVKGVKRNR